MKITKKLLAVILVLCFILTAFTGCGSKKGETASQESKVNELIMGTAAGFPPYEFRDAKKGVVGIDADIATEVAKKLGMKLTIKDMAFESLIPAVQSGSIDIIFSGMTVTEERKQSVDFTQSYATGKQVIIVDEKSPIKKLEDLKGVKIGVQSGTTGDTQCTKDFGEDNIRKYKEGSLAIAALNNKQIDCIVIDNEPAKKFVESNKNLKILKTEYVSEDYAAALAKGNEDLLKKVNKAIDELKADGTIEKIINKYYSAE